MYYIKDGMVFEPCEAGFVEISIEATRKVIVTEEIDSITITPSGHTEASLEGASVATIDEVMARFGIDEGTPHKAKGAKKAPAKKATTKK